MNKKPQIASEEDKRKAAEFFNSFPSSHLKTENDTSPQNKPKDNRVNEALKQNEKKLVSLSLKKRNMAQNFFTKPFTNDRSAYIYRTTYGPDSIPHASDADFQSSLMKTKPFIAPEYRPYKDRPDKLPTFLKEKLFADKPKVLGNISYKFPEIRHHKSESSMIKHTPLYSESSKSDKKILFSQMNQSPSDMTAMYRYIEPSEAQYLSPKARQQIKNTSVPVLLSSFFLTGKINPAGLSKQDEPAIEHIINEHHEKVKNKGLSLSQVQEKVTEAKKVRVGRAQTLMIQGNKKKESDTNNPQKSQKSNGDKIGMRLRATVGHLRMERELKRKKILNIFKTKNFNLFRPTTINNLHISKEG